MNIGKQSTLNDLGDLKKDLETKIAAAAAIKVGEVSQIESGTITSGSVYDHRPTGVYRLSDDLLGMSSFVDEQKRSESSGMMFTMKNPLVSDGSFSSNFFINYDGDMRVYGKRGSYFSGVHRVLSTKNTITDANGFIKAA